MWSTKPVQNDTSKRGPISPEELLQKMSELISLRALSKQGWVRRARGEAFGFKGMLTDEHYRFSRQTSCTR